MTRLVWVLSKRGLDIAYELSLILVHCHYRSTREEMAFLIRPLSFYRLDGIPNPEKLLQTRFSKLRKCSQLTLSPREGATGRC